jgi:hypothetical protein
MVITYTKIFIARPSKNYPNWDFGLKNKPSGNPDQDTVVDFQTPFHAWGQYYAIVNILTKMPINKHGLLFA